MGDSGGGSPDMGGVSADGKVLWLSGRYNAEVYAFDTPTGSCWRVSRSATDPTGSASFRSQAAIRWATRACSARPSASPVGFGHGRSHRLRS